MGNRVWLETINQHYVKKTLLRTRLELKELKKVTVIEQYGVEQKNVENSIGGIHDRRNWLILKGEDVKLDKRGVILPGGMAR